MKKIIFILCIFFALISVAFAAEMYQCVDKDGNSFITDNPPQDVKCESKEVNDENASQQTTTTTTNDQPAGQSGPSDSQKGETKRLLSIPR
jgi:hypothetical protein